MIAIIILVMLVMSMMARHPKRRRRMGKYIRGQVDENLPIGTLAARTLAVAGFDESVNERTFVSSLVASWSLSDWTTGQNIGPLLVGVAHSDYTAAEIEEVIENTGSWNEGDLVSQEIGKRKVRIVGTFRSANQDGSGTAVLNQGQAITTKLGWILLTGQNLDLWCYNLGSAAFATTDPDLHVEGHVNLWPR